MTRGFAFHVRFSAGATNVRKKFLDYSITHQYSPSIVSYYIKLHADLSLMFCIPREAPVFPSIIQHFLILTSSAILSYTFI